MKKQNTHVVTSRGVSHSPTSTVLQVNLACRLAVHFSNCLLLCDFAGQVIAVLKVDQSTKKQSIIGKYQERRTFPVAPKQIPIPTSGEKKYFLADESILQQL